MSVCVAHMHAAHMQVVVSAWLHALCAAPSIGGARARCWCQDWAPAAGEDPPAARTCLPWRRTPFHAVAPARRAGQTTVSPGDDRIWVQYSYAAAMCGRIVSHLIIVHGAAATLQAQCDAAAAAGIRARGRPGVSGTSCSRSIKMWPHGTPPKSLPSPLLRVIETVPIPRPARTAHTPLCRSAIA